MTLGEFLALSSWDAPTPQAAASMSVALAFFTIEVGERELRTPVYDASPWLVGSGGTPLRVVELMQAINFASDVRPAYLPAGWRLACYRPASADGNRGGRYYADVGTPFTALAIPADQTVAWKATLTTATTCLISTVGDEYVDWARNRGVRPGYGFGGARQYFLPQAADAVALTRY